MLIFLPPAVAVASIRDAGYLVISVMGLSPFVTASAEWYNWAGGQIFCCPVEQRPKRRGDFEQVLSPLQYAVQLVSKWCFSWSGGGVQVPCFVCANSFCNLFALFGVAMPSPEYGTKLKDGVTLSQSVLPLAGAGGNRQNHSQRPSLGWHLKEEKA